MAKTTTTCISGFTVYENVYRGGALVGTIQREVTIDDFLVLAGLTPSRIVTATLLANNQSILLTGTDLPAADEEITSVVLDSDVGVFYQGRDVGDSDYLNFSDSPGTDTTVRITISKI